MADDDYKKLVVTRTTQKRLTTIHMEKIKRELKKPAPDKRALKEFLAQLRNKEKTLQTTEDEIISYLDESNIDKEYELAEMYREIMTAAIVQIETFLEDNRGNKQRNQEDDETSSNAGSCSSCSSGSRHVSSIRLPKLELEKYRGDPALWQEFWSQFESNVDNHEGKSQVEKFGYLKAYLAGAAAEAIAGLALTKENYQTAKNILKDRFGQKKLQINAHMNKIFSLQAVKSSKDVIGLRKLYGTCQIQIRSLDTLEVKSETYASMMTSHLLKLMPSDLSYEYSKETDDEDNFSMATLLEFLRKEVDARERHIVLTGGQKDEASLKSSGSDKTSSTWERPKQKNSPFENRKRGQQIGSTAVLNTVSEELCIFCRNTHPSLDCPTITTASKRKDVLKKRARCFLCLKYKHRTFQCKSDTKCNTCDERHNEAICEQKFPNRPEEKTDASTSESFNGCAPVEQMKALKHPVMLKTLPVKVVANNRSQKIRCLLDDGSQRSFICEKTSRELKLPVVGTEMMRIFPFGKSDPIIAERRLVKFTIYSTSSEKQIEIIAREEPKISAATIKIPSEAVCKEMEIRGFKLAEDSEEGDLEIKLLIASDYYWKIATCRTERITDSLVGIHTLFGWVIQGVDSSEQARKNPDKSVNTVSVMKLAVEDVADEELASHQLKKFWETESIGIVDTSINEKNEDEIVGKRFESTIKYQDNRYQVALPWKEDMALTSNNYVTAAKRFSTLRKRFSNDPEFYRRYADVIEDYLKQGIIKLVPKNEITNKKRQIYYLPHHAVIREDKASTKLRIVFDASSHEINSPSLNDCLYAGPSLNTDLLKLLITFKIKKVAFTADIEKAFLQIELSESDRDAVRFLWTTDPVGNAAPDQYRMKRVLFGVSASPYLLAATIRHHVDKFKEAYPETCHLLANHLYVDDTVGGADSDSEAFKKYQEARKIMQGASMNLRGWKTNSQTLREKWENEIKTQEDPNTEPKPEILPLFKVLGISWDCQRDELCFDITPLLQILQNPKKTKRFVLSASSKIFDPVGFLSPYTIRIKMLFQEIWERGTEWDASLDEDLMAKWNDWCRELPSIQELSIPRYYMGGSDEKDIISYHLDCFSDSSEKAYGAVLYLRWTYSNGRSDLRLVASKSRVAPLGVGEEGKNKRVCQKTKMTIPRLELMGAVVAVRLTNHIKEYFACKNPTIQYWCDSQAALGWIRGTASRWKPFVANRVREIQQGSEPSTWRHCPGKLNPADTITRGKNLQELIRDETWWKGPYFLTLPESQWPVDKTKKISCLGDSEELRPIYQNETIQFSCVSDDDGKRPILELSRFSKLNRLVRTTAYVFRFINNIQKKNLKIPDQALRAEEIERAELYWTKLTQEEAFPEEFHELKTNKPISKDSHLVKLVPFLDGEGAMRVKGRLEFSEFSYAQKHPLILPAKHHFSNLQINRFHDEVLHAGLMATLARSRDKFWIVRGRQVVKNQISKCLTCRRFKAKPQVVTMSPLPKERISEVPVFAVTGIDFAGPVYIKKSKTETSKAYIALFTCAVTRSIHLELVNNLSTESFILALRRFFGRRGVCQEIISDNAKTFKRAAKDLSEIWKTMYSPEVQEFLGHKRIKWSNIVERAPWFGGFYERLVRSIKQALKRTLGRAHLTYEEFETTLIETEAVLNSRPLTYVENDVNEPSPLTPAHFLLGNRVNLLPSKHFKKPEITKEGLTKRLRYRQSLLDAIWNRWRKEYLTQLRSAHESPNVIETKEIKADDVVLVSDDKQPRQVWTMARVTETFRGRDGKVRACALKTPRGLIRRPVKLLYSLEVDN